MKNLGNGIYSSGKIISFDVPEMLKATNTLNTTENRMNLANQLKATMPIRWPECDINIVESRS